MNLDLRIPMGMMFTLVGRSSRRLGWRRRTEWVFMPRALGSIEFVVGLVLLVFGLTMFLLGRRRQKQLASLPPEPAEKGEVRRGH